MSSPLCPGPLCSPLDGRLGPQVPRATFTPGPGLPSKAPGIKTHKAQGIILFSWSVTTPKGRLHSVVFSISSITRCRAAAPLHPASPAQAMVGRGTPSLGNLTGPYWPGLDQTGLDWTSMDQTGPDWTGLDQYGPDWTRLDRTGPVWTRLDQTGLDWTSMDQTRPDWTRPDRTGPDWTRLDRTGTGLTRTGPDWTRTGPDWTGLDQT